MQSPRAAVHWCDQHFQCVSKHSSCDGIAAWTPASSRCLCFRPTSFGSVPIEASTPSSPRVSAGCTSVTLSCVAGLHWEPVPPGCEVEKSNTGNSNLDPDSPSDGSTKNRSGQIECSTETHSVRVRESLTLLAGRSCV